MMVGKSSWISGQSLGKDDGIHTFVADCEGNNCISSVGGGGAAGAGAGAVLVLVVASMISGRVVGVARVLW